MKNIILLLAASLTSSQALCMEQELPKKKGLRGQIKEKANLVATLQNAPQSFTYKKDNSTHFAVISQTTSSSKTTPEVVENKKEQIANRNKHLLLGKLDRKIITLAGYNNRNKKIQLNVKDLSDESNECR